jgi:hypothetical protein
MDSSQTRAGRRQIERPSPALFAFADLQFDEVEEAVRTLSEGAER